MEIKYGLLNAMKENEWGVVGFIYLFIVVAMNLLFGFCLWLFSMCVQWVLDYHASGACGTGTRIGIIDCLAEILNMFLRS